MRRVTTRLAAVWIGGLCVLSIVACAGAQDQGPDGGSAAAAVGGSPSASAEETSAEAPAPEASSEPAAVPSVDEPGEASQPTEAAAVGEAAEVPAAPAPAADAAAAQAAYKADLAAWKDLLKQMRQLRADFNAAAPDQAQEIQRQWQEATATGERLLAQVRQSGQAAFAAAPGQDIDLQEFLVALVRDHTLRDDYEPAAEIARTLLENGAQAPVLYEPAGLAMLAVNDFETAEKYLKLAQESGNLRAAGSQFLADLPSYKEFWKREQALRQKEAQADDLPRVKLTTTAGEMVIELLENEAPETVGNFMSLVESGFYDGLTFHRVLPGFMAQGGCPLGDGTGGPGYNIYCESQREDHRQHFRGSLSMAHAGRDTGGSQFFLTFVPTPHLNGKHTVFGRVIEGLDVLAKLRRIDPQAEGPKPEPDKISKATVIRKRDHEYAPHKVQ